MRLAVTIWIAGVLICGSILAQEPEPMGEQFQVNSYTTDYQFNPDIAVDAQGNFVVVWDSAGSESYPGLSVQAQRFDASGTPSGGQFQVNSYTTSGPGKPAVAPDAQGNFVVVWNSVGSYGTDTSYRSIQAQRFDSSGTPVGGQFQVNSYTTSYQYNPDIAVDAQGNFAVVWGSNGSYGTDTSYGSIQAQRFDSSGTPVGGEFQVNSYTTSYQFSPDIAVDAQGNFAVVWGSNGSYGTDTSYGSIQAQRFDSSGTPVGGQFQVNSYTTDYQFNPDIAVDAQGNFVVVWDSAGSIGSDNPGYSVQAQRFDASGTPSGGQFQVNSYTTSGQGNPAVAPDAQGNFVVVWDSNGSYGTDTSYRSIQAQRYDSSGAPVGGEFQVNSYTTSSQIWPRVAFDSEDKFVVAWQSVGSYGTDPDTSIQAQRYAVPIFTDGFESGDASAWSSTVP